MDASWAARWAAFALLLFLNERSIEYVNGEILTPPYFNLASDRKITATATCGEDTEGPELYCKLVGTKSDNDIDVNVIQGQFCDVCDPTKADKMHPPDFAVDGMETWWQSPPLSRGSKYNKVNLTIDLGQEFHVAYVYIRMGPSPRPGLWVLEKSADYGLTYTPWQYFSDSTIDCETYFGAESLQPISRDDSVICSTEFSNILPLEGGEIPISLLINRPSANHYFNSTVLQEWTRATNVRLRFLRTKNFLGHLMSVAKQDPTVTRRYFYSIKDISIGGRCMCNGHADTCDIQDPVDPSVLLCRCQHHTCGAKCNSCCPGFVQKAWRISKHDEPFQCERCNCFQHTDECLYDAEVDKNSSSLDIYGNYNGGGVCQNCRHNTRGINCNQCLPKYYKPFDKQWNETDVCQRCECDNFYSTGNCNEGTGKCECRTEFEAPDCDKCSFGYYGYPNCRQCECFLNGTENLQCEPRNGQCSCLSNFGGEFCKECAPGFYNFPECTQCECHAVGSVSATCDQKSGNCTCSNQFAGKHCDACQNGWFGFPNCSYCSCDLKGTVDEICDKTAGKCICKEGYGGERCDKCVDGYFGYPDCQPCNCGKPGSLGKTCSAAGKCSCSRNYAGKTCEQCSPGYFNYTECKACECDTRGSNGESCDSEGKCECHINFDGKHCDGCKEGFYNFPICEDCNCHPAGVVEGFAGCGSVPAGELCQCKTRVRGRICDKCKPLYWNLNPNNPQGCEDCYCNPAGVLGGIAVCDGESGNCVCKPSVVARDCSQCADGSFRLEENDLFGCRDCGCDIGGSVSRVCDKKSGKCECGSRVSGLTCNEPLSEHYFPTLYQYQFEVEDGYTPSNTPARYKNDEHVFPGFSWKAYAVFSPLQNEILQDIYIYKSSLYLMVIRFVNPNPETLTGNIRIIPETTHEVEQKLQVQFKSSREPTFVTVSSGTPFIITHGRWTVSIQSLKGLFVDYFVLVPEDFYSASILKRKIENPCKVNETVLCRQYDYPNLTNYDTISFNYGLGPHGNEISELYSDENHLSQVNVKSKLPVINGTQPHLTVTLNVVNNKPGAYVLILNYVTPLTDPRAHKLKVNVTGKTLIEDNQANLHSCTFTMLCRQVVLTPDGKVGVFEIEQNSVTVDLQGSNDANVAIHSVTAVPFEQWSLDFITPSPRCVFKDEKCMPASFLNPQETKKLLFEQLEEGTVSKNVPLSEFGTTSYFLIDSEHQFTDLRGKVPTPGYYTFIVHYYQPYYPEFSLDVLIQNGQFYEAKIPLKHCPSQSGCRSVITEKSGKFKFNLIENFMITFKDPGLKSAFLFYILLVPSDYYTLQFLEEEDFDQAGEFLKTCGSNNYYIDPSVGGFCRDSVSSIVAAHNGGALPCECNFDGSTEFDCEKFGGQCPCKPNVIGRQCAACKAGYYGFPDCTPCNCPSTAYCEPSTGRCICPPRVTGEKCDQCVAYTYGYDPLIGCEECKCDPLGVYNDLQCDLNNGTCACKRNIVGRRCDVCQAGYSSYPHCDLCECDQRGTTEDICDQTTAECFCKKNAIGPACDICQEGTFNLQSNNEHGCTECFCFGKTTRCTSSKLIRISVIDMTDWNLVEMNLTSKFETRNVNISLTASDGDVGADFALIEANNASLYFSASKAYLGKKLPTYGGFLNYSIFYTIDQKGSAVSGADVILQGNNTYLTFVSLEQPPHATQYSTSVQLVESNFELPLGIPAKREHIMEALRDLKGIYIRAKYWTDSVTTRLSRVSLDDAVSYQYYHDDPSRIIYADSVEQCQCPPGYRGGSCEDCAPGYYRINKGPHGGYCVQCQCNGHAQECDVNTGICLDCEHHTRGEHCETCDVGYHGNSRMGTPKDCLICACPLPITSNNFATGCDLSSDGEKISCDCVDGYVGAKCESCAPGFYGRPAVSGDFCKPCQCSGNINPADPASCDTVTGECLHCLNNTFGTACSLCAPGYFGDAINLKDCQNCICDQMGTDHCDSANGECKCKPNVVGEKCDRCAYEHYGFQSGLGCTPCLCAEASESNQCEDATGQCKCKEGVSGRSCDKCAPGHWNYTESGCQSCGCKSDYSVGFGCNANTGQCECLQGVIGEKCNQCPHRWAFVPDYGCHQCDMCTDALLDSTDALSILLDPIILDFDTTRSGYFTTKRLENMKKMLEDLEPKFDEVDPSHINLNSSLEHLQLIESEAKNLNRKTNYSLENSVLLKNSSDVLNKKLQDLHGELMTTEEKAIRAVDGLLDILDLLNTGDSPEIESATTEANRILKSIETYDLKERQTKTTDQLKKAVDLLESLKEFEKPTNDLTNHANQLKDHLRNISSKLDDLYNNTQYSLNKAIEAEHILGKSGFESLKNKLDTIENQTLRLNKDLEGSDNINKNLSKVLEGVKLKILVLNEVPKTLEGKLNDFNSTLVHNHNNIEKIDELIPQVEKHANETSEKLQELENILSESQDISVDALKAANAYKDIVEAVQSAHEAADQANTEALGVADSWDGIYDKTYDADQNSSTTLSTAHLLKSNTTNDLRPSLEEAKRLFTPVKSTHLNNDERYKALLRQIEMVPASPSDEMYNNVIDKAMHASQYIGDVAKNLEENFVELPKQKEEAHQLPKIVDDTDRNIQQTQKQLNSINEKLPQLIETIDKLPEKQKRLQDVTDNLKHSIDRLNQQVKLARDLANRIDIGVKFYPNTTLELRNPNNLEDLSTSTKVSGYFRTDKLDGLILYLGNPVGTSLRRTKSDDYLALVIQNGYPVLKLNLGNGDEQITNEKNVADNKWYQFIIERTGLNAKLTIKEEVKDEPEKLYTKELGLEGPYSIFNLDRNKSRLFVGGTPVEYEIQQAVEYNSFDGEIDELMIGDVPISLWNFNNGYENNHGAKRTKMHTVKASGLRFNGNGYAVFNARVYNLKLRSDIQLMFRTYEPEGLLFLGESNGTFISLELRDGYILYQYNLGEKTKRWVTPKTFNDGEWHTIVASREGPSAQLTIDNENVPDHTVSIGGRFLNAIEVISFGGYPGGHNLSDVTNSNFRGCMDKAVIMGNNLDFNKNIRAYDVTPGCTKEVAQMVSFAKERPGFVMDSRLSVSNDFKISLKFKTKEKDGLIFYGTNQEQSDGISLSMVDGRLKLISQRTELESKDLFNDSDWHVISVMHTNHELRIDFDDWDFRITDSPPTPLLILYGNLYIGGIPENFTPLSGTVGSSRPFAGCIGDLTFNGNVTNFADMVDRRRRQNAVLGKCILDIVHEHENPDVHKVPTLPSISDGNSVVITEPPPITEDGNLKETTIRGDVGSAEIFTPEPPKPQPEPSPVTEPIDRATEPIDRATEPVDVGTQQPPGPIGSVPPPTESPPSKLGCALSLPDSSNYGGSYRFGTMQDGRLIYSTARGRFKKTSDHHLEFKTTESEGMLFYISDHSVDHTVYMALYLHKGEIVFTFSGGDEAAIMRSTNVYNDDTWHTVEFSRDGRNGKLVVDRNTPVSGTSGELGERMELKTPFYVGGLNPSDRKRVYQNLETNEAFKGCIRTFLMGGKPMINPEENGVTPCFEPDEPGTLFFGPTSSNEPNSSFMKIRQRFFVGENFDVKMDIKPRVDSALLIAIHGKRDYLVLEMVNSTIRFTVENGRGPITATYNKQTPYYLCDGKWHNIQAVKSKNVVTLSVDNEFSESQVGDHQAVSTTTGSALFLGGHRYLKRIRGVTSKVPYIGCIKNVVINNEPVELQPSMVTGNISVGSCMIK